MTSSARRLCHRVVASTRLVKYQYQYLKTVLKYSSSTSTSTQYYDRAVAGTWSVVWWWTTCVAWRSATCGLAVSCSTWRRCCRSTSSSCVSEFTRCCARHDSSRPTDSTGTKSSLAYCVTTEGHAYKLFTPQSFCKWRCSQYFFSCSFLGWLGS